MKEKIMLKANEMFLKLGFKSVTMDDIAGEMCISKKTIYKYFCNKELLVEETTERMHQEVNQKINELALQNFNAIEENFEIQKMFKEMFKSYDTSPVYQLKKHYPMIFMKIQEKSIEFCNSNFRNNIEKGIREGLYRTDLDIKAAVDFYYTLIFYINENTIYEKDVHEMEIKALEYHTRAIATPKGVLELEKHLQNPNI
ncbi:TetR/AcrR family transcriptional regulator [Flavobacterium sp.]|uniref:TetR/AcrR family transcriptional regulator n=1 Tax=Flavobacterium sp. TaxID=239 RepID=UPI0028BDED53|nr:TetR/AcrR family transcriptional regulator [Flavobacterium sp.]